MGALNDLSLIAEGFSSVMNAMGEEGLGLSLDDWRGFSMSTSAILGAAYKRADEEIVELRDASSKIYGVVDELRREISDGSAKHAVRVEGGKS